MQLHNMRRAARNAVPLVVLCVAGVVACSDEASAPKEPDAFAEQAIIGMRVRAEGHDVSGSSAKFLGSRSEEVVLPVISDWPQSAGSLNQAGTSRAVVRHFKDREGRIHSLGAIPDASGAPPKLTYAFENGKIRAIVGSDFQRHGKGWVRTRSRITYFDSLGNPRLQVDVKPDVAGMRAESNATNGFAKLTGDILGHIGNAILPAELHAEEFGCTSEWLAYATASFVLASASAAVTAAGAGCFETGTTCKILEQAITVWLAAVMAWNAAFDKLVACQLQNDLALDQKGDSDGDGSGGGGDGGGSGSVPEDADDIQSTTKTVQQFIDDAIAVGNFKCSASGDYCVYYAT